jgi:23S rRNA pseudouridine1911/1915/1917 synthase
VHSIERSYLAFVAGAPSAAKGMIDLPIGRHPIDRKRMGVVGNGRSARTHYQVEARYGLAATLLRCTLETGRTHQIRVHLSYQGVPVLGDPVYMNTSKGRRNALKPVEPVIAALGRQALHATVLGFNHPISGEFVRFETALPSDLQELHNCLIAAYS